MNPIGGWIASKPLFPLYNPGIIAIPVGFISAIIASLVSRKSSQEKDEERTQFFIKAQTGIDMRGKSM